MVKNHLPEKSESEARAMINAWLKSGTLVEVYYEDPEDRKKRKGLRVDVTKRPSV